MVERSVKVSQETLHDIELLKVHPRQPADEIIGKAVSLLKAFREAKKSVLGPFDLSAFPPALREPVKKLWESL